MKAHHSFAWLMRGLTHADKDADTQIISLKTPCTGQMLSLVRSSADCCAWQRWPHAGVGAAPQAGVRSPNKQESVLIWPVKGLAAPRMALTPTSSRSSIPQREKPGGFSFPWGPAGLGGSTIPPALLLEDVSQDDLSPAREREPV